MIRHALILSFRNFKRYKSSFIINVVGLSIGLASVLLIYIWTSNELSTDRFHEKDDRLYQVMRNVTEDKNDIVTFDNNSDFLAPALKEELPEIENIVPVSETIPNGLLSTDEKSIKANGQFAGKDFFNIFSFQLTHGDKDHVLDDKYAIVISNEVAKNLFGSVENSMGKSIILNEEQFGDTYIISGSFKKNRESSESFDFIGTNEMFLEKNAMDAHWDSNTVHTFLTLKEGVDVVQFDAKIKDFVKEKFKAQYGTANLKWVGQLFLRPYSDKYLFNHYENGVQTGGRISYVIIFSIVGLFILLIACINFMNLSTARASRRLKEVGIKKVVGADRKALIFQYMGESMVLTFLSMIVALSIAFSLLPQFNLMAGKDLTINWDWKLLCGILVIILTTGLISGSYPALYLSGFKPSEVLKGKLNTTLGEVLARRGLVIFQFCISTLLIISVLIAYKQINFVQSKNLGYNKDNIISFKRQGGLNVNLPSFINAAKNIQGVINASDMEGDLLENHGEGGGIDWEGKAQRVEFASLEVDHDLIEIMGVPVIEGRSFSPNFSSDSSAVIFNETAIKAMGLEDPIGKTVKRWGKQVHIIGIVKDFHFESLYEKVMPFFFSYSNKGDNVIIKIQSGMEREAIAKIEDLYHSFNSGIPFEYKFLDDSYEELYRSEQRVADLALYFAGIAILISCLGLYGIVSFTAERRTKEIGIRKILGSTEFGIVYLLSLDFTKMVLTSVIIALPIGYFLSKEWLDKFAYRISLEWWYFIVAGLVALFITWLTVGSQAIRAARVNPTKSLRSE